MKRYFPKGWNIKGWKRAQRFDGRNFWLPILKKKPTHMPGVTIDRILFPNGLKRSVRSTSLVHWG